MRVTQIVCRQHIDRMFKKHWRVQGQRIPIETGAEAELQAGNIPTINPDDVVRESPKKHRFDIVGSVPKPIPMDKTHPNWHERKCLFFRDNNVLLEGVDQVKILTNTIELQNGSPDTFDRRAEVTKEMNSRALEIITTSHLYDVQQEKLPKKKDPLRPAFNFPRPLGITNERKNHLLISKLLHFCESYSDKSTVKQRTVLNDACFSYRFQNADDSIQFELRADKMILSSKPLNQLTEETGNSVELPDLYPVKHTITLVPENIYESRDLYPVRQTVLKYHPHTIFVYYNPSEVENLYGEEVTENQVTGRSLLKVFTVAAAYARQKFGNNVKVLPTPVILQCIQTDGKRFHFSILQLNTLDLTEGNVKNIWYNTKRLSLYDSCAYKLGIPSVEGYNSEVISKMSSFYNNV